MPLDTTPGQQSRYPCQNSWGFSTTEYRQYENGVADVLGFLLDDAAEVKRNVRLRGSQSGKMRQIDILVSGQVFGLHDAQLVVDCKRWGRKIGVRDVEGFLGLLEDVRADLGLLVTTAGTTDGARERARAARGMRVEVMTLGQLSAWKPRGTVFVNYRVPIKVQETAERLLRDAGFRVTPAHSETSTSDEIQIEVFRHYGVDNPSGDIQREHSNRVEEALSQAGISPLRVSSGVTIGGGTPGHRWLEVTLAGHATGLRVLAASEDDINSQLESLAKTLSVPRDQLDVLSPTGWPVAGVFGI